MILKHLIEGGPAFMFSIAFMWIVVIFLTIRLFLNYFSDKRNVEKLAKYNSMILYIGSFAFIFGIFGQIIGLYGALDAIERAGDIAPFLIAGGLKVSLLTVIYGLSLLLFSSIVWYTFRNLLKK